MLVNNVKQAALNCPAPAAFLIPSKFNYFLRNTTLLLLLHIEIVTLFPHECTYISLYILSVTCFPTQTKRPALQHFHSADLTSLGGSAEQLSMVLEVSGRSAGLCGVRVEV